jgi:hypothetical protein
MTFEKKPSTAEDEYFAREDAESLRRLHYEELKRLRQSEREALRKLHQGRCSECGALMVPEQASMVQFLHCHPVARELAQGRGGRPELVQVGQQAVRSSPWQSIAPR